MCVPLVVFETKGYPWKRLRKHFFWRQFPNVWKGLSDNPYLGADHYSKSQHAFEFPRFFPDGSDALPKGPHFGYVQDANDETTIKLLDDAKPDIVYVYGTGLLKSHVFDQPPMGSINAHGGLLPNYRGLDTNLWATLLDGPEQMAVTLHKVTSRLDQGGVFMERRLLPAPEMSVASLRYFTAKICTDMFVQISKELIQGSLVEDARNPADGKYFGPMPLRLKMITDRKLHQWGQSLSDNADIYT